MQNREHGVFQRLFLRPAQRLSGFTLACHDVSPFQILAVLEFFLASPPLDADLSHGSALLGLRRPRCSRPFELSSLDDPHGLSVSLAATFALGFVRILVPRGVATRLHARTLPDVWICLSDALESHLSLKHWSSEASFPSSCIVVEPFSLPSFGALLTPTKPAARAAGSHLISPWQPVLVASS